MKPSAKLSRKRTTDYIERRIKLLSIKIETLEVKISFLDEMKKEREKCKIALKRLRENTDHVS